MPNDFPDLQFFKVEKVIEKVLKENHLQEVYYFTRIVTHWPVIVGEPLARKAVPLKLERYVLQIGVVDSAYSHHLRFYENRILDLIASPEICGENAVRKILFRTIAPDSGPATHPQTTTTPSKHRPMSSAEESRVSKTSGQISDQQLKSFFSRYMGKLISR